MKNKEDIIERILALFVAFITATVLPSVLSSILGTDKNIAIFTGFVSVALLTIIYLIRHIIKYARRFRNGSEHLKNKYAEMRLYAISSSYWCDLFSQKDFRVNKCTVMIRGYIDGLCDKEQYQHEVETAIHRWKQLRHSGRITHLIIYTYDHIPDNYFVALDYELVYVGLNNFDSHDSTGQMGYRASQELYSGESKNTQKYIQQYINHFDNYIESGRCSLVYDSSLA